MVDREWDIPTGDLLPQSPSEAIRFATAQVDDIVFDPVRLAALVSWVEVVVLDFLASHRDERDRNSRSQRKWTYGLLLSDLSDRAVAIFGCNRPDLVRDAVEFALAQGKVEVVQERPEVGTVRYGITDFGYGLITKIRGDSNDEFAAARKEFQRRFRQASGRELSHDAFVVFTALVNRVCRHAVEHGLVQWGGTRVYIRNGIDGILAADVVTRQGFFLGELGRVAEGLLLDAFEPHNTILNAHVDKCLRIQQMLNELTDERLRQIGLVKEVARQLHGSTAVLDVDMVAEFFGLWAYRQDFLYLWPMIGYERLGGRAVVLDEAWAEFDRVAEWNCRQAIRLARTARQAGEEVDDEEANVFVRAFFDLKVHVGHRDPVELFRRHRADFRASLPVSTDSAKRLARPDEVARARSALDEARPPRPGEPETSKKREDDAELLAYLWAANGDVDPKATMANTFLVTRAQRVDVAYRAAFGDEARLVINPRNASTLVTALASATRSKLLASTGSEYSKRLYYIATGAPFIPVVDDSVAEPTSDPFLFPDDSAPSRATIQQEAAGRVAEFNAHAAAARAQARTEAAAAQAEAEEPAEDEEGAVDAFGRRQAAWALTGGGAVGGAVAVLAWPGSLVVRLVVAVAILTAGGCAGLVARSKPMLAATVAGAVAAVLTLVLTLPPPARATGSSPLSQSVERRSVRE